MTTPNKLAAALERIAGKNDLSGIPDDEVEAAARHALYECELIAREALTSQPPASDAPVAWRPIESAPKDGTTIDVWRDGSRETVYWGFPPHECGEMGQYCDSDWHSIKNPGWICSTFGEFVGGKHDPFTHWMPLPAAPGSAPDQRLGQEGEA